jgi:energy-coupling factor transport system permease protein
VALTGVVVGAVLIGTSRVDPTDLNPSLQPLTWPPLPLVPALGIVLGSLPAWLAPPLARPTRPARSARSDGPGRPAGAPAGAPAAPVAAP